MAIIHNAPIRTEATSDSKHLTRPWMLWCESITNAIKTIFPSLSSTPNYVWADMTIPAMSMRPHTANAPDFDQTLIPYGGSTEYGYFPENYIVLDSTSGAFFPYNSNFGYFPKSSVSGATTNLRTFVFDAATEEELFFTVEIPHTWKVEGPLRAHLHWMKTTGDSGNVIWGLEYSWISPGSDADPVQVLDGIETPVVEQDSQWGHQITRLGDIVGPSDAKESSILLCRLFRNASDSDDTYTQDAALLSCSFHYRVGKLGSGVEFPT